MPDDYEIITIQDGEGPTKKRIKYKDREYKMPRLYWDKKTQRQFIRMKKKRIWVDNDISERQLIKFIIKQLAPRDHKPKKEKAKRGVKGTRGIKERANHFGDLISTGRVSKNETPSTTTYSAPLENSREIEALKKDIKRLEHQKEKLDDMMMIPKEVFKHGQKQIAQKEENEEKQITEKNAKKLYEEMAAPINKNTLPVLRKMLDHFGIQGYWRMNKSELVDLLVRAGWDGVNIPDDVIQSLRKTPSKIPILKKNESSSSSSSSSSTHPKYEIVFEDEEGEGKHKNVDSTGLNTSQIDAIMKQYPEFLGAIPSDGISSLLPRVKPNSRICFIMNTEPHNMDGDHWVAILVDARDKGSKSIEFYNPLGIMDRRRITAQFLKDIVPLLQKINPTEIPLKLKENLVSDQNNTSSNCGEFSIRFLLDRITRDKTFAEATSYDSKGEKMIEKWKDEFYPFRNILQNGKGIVSKIKDGYNYVKGKFKNVVDGIKGGVRKDFSPSIRNLLAKIGSESISEIKVCRKPINSMVNNVLNWASSGKLEQNTKEAGYDKLMHLFMLIKLANGQVYQAEKNHVIEMKKASWDTSGEQERVNVKSGLTLNKMFENAIKSQGENFFIYDSKKYNCQRFIEACLRANGMWNSVLQSFVLQNAESIYKNLGLLEKAAKEVTDVANKFDVALNGRGR